MVVGWWLAVVGGVWLAVSDCRGLLCDDAHRKCIYRTGCGNALSQYMIHCSSLSSQPDFCPESCQHALIALMSTTEGKALMTCECRDESCRRTKERVEVCRPHVLNASHNQTVNCELAQWICSADTACYTAFLYYRSNCRSMIRGKRCSAKCKNSITILQRQEKAAKLEDCECSGREAYNCLSIRSNMERMCFGKKHQNTSTTRDDFSNEVHTEPDSAIHIASYPLFVLLSALLSLR